MTIKLPMLLFVGLVVGFGGVAPAAGQQTSNCLLTVIIEGGDVYDGRGTEPIVTDVGILGNRIAAVGDLDGCDAGRKIDATGLAVVPGFIDIHSHGTRGVFRYPLAENLTRQGVTTAIGGPDGSSPYPVGEYLARLDATPAAVNFGLMVGHGTIRRGVMGNEDRTPTSAELDTMAARVGRAMADGAFGLSSGLKYVPGAYAKTEEVIALARVAGYFGGIYITHMREEGLQLLDAVRETIRIGEEGGLPTQITHHKVVGAPMWGASTESLALVDAARARGVDVTIDQYPYTASSTGLTILFPAWSLEGSRLDLLARLGDTEQRQRIKDGITANLRDDRGGNDPKNVVLARCGWDSTLDGLSLAEVLTVQDRQVDLPTAAELTMELQAEGGCSGIFHAMAEEDVLRIMRHPQTMVASDGGIVAPGEGVPHPRNYGTFSRVLGHYSRDLGVLRFAEAIRKMTSLPADRLDLVDRGIIEAGAYADLAVLDRDAIDDPAVFENPHQYATGAAYVFVNGVAVILDGEVTGTRPGRTLRHEP